MDPKKRKLEKEELQTLNSRLELHVLKLREKEAEEDFLRKEVERLQGKLTSEEERFLRREQEIQRLKEHIVLLEEHLKEKQKIIEDLTADAARSDASHAVSVSLANQNKELSKEIIELKAEIEKLKAKAKKDRSTILPLEEVIKGLKHDILELNAKIQDLETQVAEKKELREEIESLRVEITEEQSKRSRLELEAVVLQGEKKGLQDAIERLQEIIKKLQLPEAPALGHAEINLAARVKELEEALVLEQSRLRREFGLQLREIVDEVKQTEAKRLTASEEKYEKKIHDLTKQLTEARAELEKLRPLEGSQEKIRRLQATVAALQREAGEEFYARLESNLKAKKENIDRISAFISEERKYDFQSQEYIAKLASSNKEIVALKTRVGDAEGKAAALQAELDRMRAEPAEQELASLRAEIEAYRQLINAEEERVGEDERVDVVKNVVISEGSNKSLLLNTTIDVEEAVNLTNWSIKFILSNFVFKFEEKTHLEPGRGLRVAFGEAGPQEPNVRQIVVDDKAPAERDIALLLNETGATVARFVFE